MKAGNQTPRFTRSSALMFAASVAIIVLCVGSASAQSCPNTVAPGEALNLTEASTGNATSLSFSHGLGVGGEQGFYDPSVNQVGAAAVVDLGVAGAKASAYGQINYLFCVLGNANDHVNANITASVEWVGVLYGASLGPRFPSVTGTLSLVDMGTDGSQSNVIASSQPLSANLGTVGIQVEAITPGFGYTFITGSGQAPMTNVPLITGHQYAIQYNLDCEAPSGVAGVAACNFAPLLNFSAPPGLPVGNYNSTVDSLSLTLDQDLYGALAAIKANTDGLAAQVSANRQAIAAANLTAEQENAQLLGILNEIRSLLSTLQPAPAARPPAKTGIPKGPVRPRIIRRP